MIKSARYSPNGLARLSDPEKFGRARKRKEVRVPITKKGLPGEQAKSLREEITMTKREKPGKNIVEKCTGRSWFWQKGEKKRHNKDRQSQRWCR